MRHARRGGKRGRSRGMGSGKREGEEEYRGYFCAICGKKAGGCGHGRLFFYIGDDGEQVGAV